MTTNLRTRFLSAGIFFVLIASAILTVPARADSGSPPPAPPTPGGSSHSTAQAPSGGTTTSGGGDQSHKVELSNQNAAYIAPAGDPIWCPSGVAVPVPGAGGCSANYANLYLLTNAVETGVIHPVVTNSNIWIQHGIDTSGSQILLDGSVLAALSNVSLNFKGGWNGLGTGSVNPATPSIFNGVGFSIGNWHNSVTMSNITVNNSTGGQDGFYIQSNKLITLTNVVAYHGGDHGGYLDNSAGTGVTITNSSFTQNNQFSYLWGLVVYSGGPITLTGVIVNQDYFAGGALLDNSSVPNKPVVIKSSYFDNNQIYSLGTTQYGLWVISKGAITLTNVSASGNYNAPFATGAVLDNSSSITAAPVTLTGTNIFDSNANDGLDVLSNGKITSASIIASTNVGTGVSFDNHTAVTAQPVTLTGNSTFNFNGSYGLNVLSKGVVLTNGLSAISNLGYGVSIINDIPGYTSPVTLKGVNTFNNNGSNGLNVISNGAVLTSGLTALSNSNYGVNIINSGPGLTAPVTLNGLNTFNFNGSYGLNVISNGAVVANSLTAISNGGTGVNIINSTPGSTAPVTLKGLSTFNNNNGSEGLNVISNGAVVTNGLTAISNAGYGVNIVNAGPSFIAPVTLNGLNTFNKNGPYGLYVVSNGAVVTNSLTALSNSGYGVNIVNAIGSSTAPVTLNGLNTFNKNGPYGLYVVSNGAVVANSLTALSNLGYGVNIINAGASFAAPVTLKGLGTFNNNGPYGLYVISNGAVVTNGLTAISNSGYGVNIVNAVGSSTAPVTLNGLNTFNFNGPYGLYLISNGAVVANSLTALSNLGYGVNIINAGASFAAPVTLKGLGTFNNNGPYGLFVASKGAVLTSALTAISNSGYGAYIVNAGASSAAPVTLKGLGIFNNNGPYGLNVLSNGAVVTNGLNALSNNGFGVFLDDSSSTANSPVTLNGLNIFNFNSLDGLHVTSKGPVVANSLTAISNIAGYGVYIFNAGASFNAPVTLKGLGTFNHNGSDGLHILSRGAVLTSAITALSNSGYGAFIFNAGASTGAPVTLKGLGTFNTNSNSGLYVISKGAVVTNGLIAISNAVIGVDLDNSPSSTNSPVTLNGLNTLNNNSVDGLYLLSKGAITTNNLTASNNGVEGAFLDNGMLGAAGAVNVKGKNILWNNAGGAGLDIVSYGPVTVTNVSSKWNGTDGLFVDTLGNVVVSCGSFFSNGTAHVTGYGWETGSSVPHITLIGVKTGGNFSGDFLKDNAGTIVTNISHPCNLP